MNKDTRTAQVLMNEEWVKIEVIDIKKGMIFKLFEEDGTPVLFQGKNKDTFSAKSDAYLNSSGHVCISIDVI